MRKSLFAIGLLAAGYSVQAQNILCHVDTNANMYVSKGTLVYSGGGMQMKGNGRIENHGNVMVAGSASDSFKTIDASNTDKTESNGGNNFVNVINEPTSYATVNTNSSTATPSYTYGQLFITGIPQSNITGIVDQQYRAVNHGAYQQVGMPFYAKTLSTLNTELGKTFSGVRGSGNDILQWNNANVVFNHFTNLTYRIGIDSPLYGYYILGGTNLDVSNTTRTLTGRPYSDTSGTSVTLTDAGANVNFGTGGGNLNQYNEKYWSYVQDGFHIAAGGTAWQGNYGKNIYQFSNPFLTNLDLRWIATNESATSGDGINLSNIQAVRFEVSGVQYSNTNNGGGGSASYKFVSFASNLPAGLPSTGGSTTVPTGDLDYLVVRPMSTFVIKMKDNTVANQVLNFNNLRRFNYFSRATGTDYGVSASKSNTSTSGTVKQLGIIGLDVNGNEVARTYYVVFPNGTTGHSSNALTQISTPSGNVLGTFEEDPAGGYDNNYTNQYWLYINEANENNFKGKNIKMVNYDLSKIKSYKFEIRENAELVSNGTHQLSTGIGFYYKTPNGTAQAAVQGGVVPVSDAVFDLYYGEPNSVLAVDNTSVKPSRTMVVYNPDVTNYIVRFDPNWKKADIEVYDMSGKLVISKKAVSTSKDFVIELDNALKNSYVVKIVSDKGETVNTKILK
ncbi:T9SS type A sorting domain-containing protein [uncultured Chryseobacterium sp.]|uniref:T9SS type A sorting domain-containing protein n=1 Tax=uncultured Chryseobacterium sp. TaxID=259322 RepID=UPI0025E1664E|nr:T9SS type A sorting domain-containing protein [uncultured Chryseobacterium sp.]